MAEASEKMSPSKRPLHFLLRCFGSSPKVQTKKNPTTGRRDSRIPSPRFRFKKSSATVPIDVAVPEITVPCDDKASFSPEFKKPPPSPLIKSRAPTVRTKIVELIKPSQTWKKTESTRSDSLTPAKRTAALLHSISLPSRRLNRQKDLKKTVSHLSAVKNPTPTSSERRKPADKPPMNSPAKILDLIIVIVAVAIVVLWGQLCAILCTTALFYFCRRLRSETESEGGGKMRVLNRKGGGFGKVSGEVCARLRGTAM